MTGLAVYAVHEAEMEIARATAVRALMQTGATHDEAVAAVREHIRADGPRHGLTLAVNVDHLTVAMERIGAGLAAVGQAMSRAFTEASPRFHQLRHMLAEDDVYAWVKRNPEWPFCCPECADIIPLAGRTPGPRTVLRCDDCRVQWRAGCRLWRETRDVPSITMRRPHGPRWVGARR